MKTKFLLLATLLFLLTTAGYAQVTIGSLGFNYTALVRDTAGRTKPNTKVMLKFSLAANALTPSTPAEYVETQIANTDAYGFINVTVGKGTSQGSFSNLHFENAQYFILIQFSLDGGGSWQPLGNSEALNAVPYAKVAGVLASNSASSVPTGTIVAFAGDLAHIPNYDIPGGWLPCDGRSLSISDPKYVALFNAIGIYWGSTGSGFFCVPFTKGLFLRGANNGSGLDPDAKNRLQSTTGAPPGGDVVGSKQLDAFSYHTHGIKLEFGTQSNLNNPPPGNYNQVTIRPNFTPRTDGQLTTEGGSSETRPINVYVNYIIKL